MQILCVAYKYLKISVRHIVCKVLLLSQKKKQLDKQYLEMEAKSVFVFKHFAA